MVLNCKLVWDFISDYLDATLPDEIRSKVQKHLDHCEICSAILDSTRNIIVLTADHRVFELPAEYSGRIHARLELEIGNIKN
jgi:predicted anti-sigma-YlaC factor YlaD